jgi:hypothetical protein
MRMGGLTPNAPSPDRSRCLTMWVDIRIAWPSPTTA